jgi:hypothetical protein
VQRALERDVPQRLGDLPRLRVGSTEIAPVGSVVLDKDRLTEDEYRLALEALGSSSGTPGGFS